METDGHPFKSMDDIKSQALKFLFSLPVCNALAGLALSPARLRLKKQSESVIISMVLSRIFHVLFTTRQVSGCPERCLETVGDIDFFKDIVEVGFNRMEADVKFFGNHLV